MKNYVGTLIILLAIITIFSCADKSNEGKVGADEIIIGDKIGVDVGEYEILMNLDTALAHPLEVTHLLINNEVEYDTLPRGIGSLKNLKSLTISYQKHLDFDHLFESISKLDSLQELSIKDSNLNEKGKIKNLKQLQELTLLRNNIKTFSFDIINSLNLKVLAINEEKGFEFTGTLKKNTKLKELALYGYSGKAIDENIFKFLELERLSIKFSPLTYIGDGITNLEKLKELDIAETPLATNQVELNRLRNKLPTVKVTTLIQPPH